MSKESIYHCDGPGCDTHIRSIQDILRTSFILIKWGVRELHFCSWDCIMKYAAKIEPTEVIR